MYQLSNLRSGITKNWISLFVCLQVKISDLTVMLKFFDVYLISTVCLRFSSILDSLNVTLFCINMCFGRFKCLGRNSLNKENA